MARASIFQKVSASEKQPLQTTIQLETSRRQFPLASLGFRSGHPEKPVPQKATGLALSSNKCPHEATEKDALIHASPLLQAFILCQPTMASPSLAEAVTAVPSDGEAVSAVPVQEPIPSRPSERAQNSPEPTDPELGVIRLRDARQDSELGVIRLRNPLQDPELGILELRQFTPEPPPRPVLFVSTYASVSSSDNVFQINDPVQGTISDSFLRTGVSVTAFPALGPRTNLIASAETNLIRYQNSQESNYDELRFRAAIRHNFTNRFYGQFGWSGQLLFDEGFSDQFFTKHGIELLLGRRDNLLPRLTLDSYYQGQVFFSNPDDFSNFSQSVGTFLGYRLAPKWNLGVGYQLTFSDFIEVRRQESSQRIIGQLRYSLSPTVRVNLFGGVSYGNSSRETILFDSTFFGISIDATFRVF